jgi:putative PIN family toxin of toxin-antitoxin system
MRVVLDSNVIVSALSTEGPCNYIFEYCIKKKHTIVISQYILKEVYTTLKNKFEADETKTSFAINFLKEWCELNSYKRLTKKICRDSDDDEILALAKDNNTEYIVTGDKDLLILKKINNTNIISPREFLILLKEN